MALTGRSDDLYFLVKLSPEEISPVRAFRLAVRLGKLAPWLLRREVLRKAIQEGRDCGLSQDQLNSWESPSLPEGCGACWVATVLKMEHNAALRSAAVLPLRWKKGNSNPRVDLPPGLEPVARSVLSTLRAWADGDSGEDKILLDDDWRLQPAEDGLFDGPGAKFLQGDYSSAWVPLAAGLMLAAHHGKPDRKVWATGAWDRDAGIRSVEGIAQKLELAREFQATHFFLPEKCLIHAQDFARMSGFAIRIEPLKESQIRPRSAMKPYLQVLRVRAGREDGFEERADTYLWIDDPDDRLNYYLDCIVDDLAEHLRAKLPPHQRECRCLVTIVSGSPELVHLAHCVFRPEASLILYTKDEKRQFEKFAEKARSWLESKGIAARLRKIENGDLPYFIGEFRRCLHEMMPDLKDADSLMIDVTPGNKLMSLAWSYAAPDNARLIYLQHTPNRQTGKPRPSKDDQSISIYSVKDLRSAGRENATATL
ncbi:MAG: hypothetical protein Kow0040_28070 [Thermogutta sp.]